MSDPDTPRVNSLGMTLVPVPPGSFTMGSDDGLPDEQPVHRVKLTQGVAVAATPVTNAQYERFDPSHRSLRGKRGLSTEDDDAVIFVSWHDAVNFCRWLSDTEGIPYRLPTEAEWEYACRAGTTSAFSTGDDLPESYCREQHFGWEPEPVGLAVGQTPANPWGLHDSHGLVEEWCLDWYGPYPDEEQVDPVGPAEGTCRITRGGSHNTDVQYLRSACRLSALPDERTWAIGFRVVQGPEPTGQPIVIDTPKPWQCNVEDRPAEWPGTDAPLWHDPEPYVITPPPGSDEPFHTHNHCPSVTWCDNGDLLAAWFSTPTESSREMTILGSRRRPGDDRWEPASEFFNIPSRNLTGTALFNDGQGRLLHLNGVGVTEGWSDLALVVRRSNDHGTSWSPPELANAEHGLGNQVISGTSRTVDGTLVQPCDAVWGGDGGTAIHVSTDDGATWHNPAADIETNFCNGGTGNRIAGIHAGVVGLADGRLLAFGRGDTIAGRMPMSISGDGGRRWTYSPSPFPPISSGQRLVLMRLREGPLLFVSFTDESQCWPHPRRDDFPLRKPTGLRMTVAGGQTVTAYGMFAAVSYDDGETWPVLRPLTPKTGSVELDGGGWTGPFTLTPESGEPRGYLAATQTPDGVVHLVSSRLHYRFNLAWIESR